MSVLAVLEIQEGKVKKSGREAASYAAKVAEQLGTESVAVAIGSAEESELASVGAQGVSKVVHVNDNRLDTVDAKAFTKALNGVVEAQGAKVVVFSLSTTGKAVAPRLSARLKAGLVTGVVDLPDTGDGFVVKKSVFSNKGFAYYNISTDVKLIALAPNSYPVVKGDGTAAVEAHDAGLGDDDFGVKVTNVDVASGDTIPLPEAEKVVSAGRGLKGPENWGMIEDMAKVIGAATACSRPVSDVGWRPHHEHVGQTGITISPNLYIAVGISGAIQHLAGVSSSKTIVVINNDPEAPFFKNADYGIVGDAFEVVPKLNEALKNHFASNN